MPDQSVTEMDRAQILYRELRHILVTAEQRFTYFVRRPLLASKNNHGSSHPSSLITIQNKNLYLGTDFIKTIYCSTISNNALHDFTIIKITVARFVGTGSFLIRYSNGPTTSSRAV